MALKTKNGYAYEEVRYSFQDFECTLPVGKILFTHEYSEQELERMGYFDKDIIVECITPSKVRYNATLYDLKVRLLELVKKFVMKHIVHYYQQYRGDIMDLVYEYYVEFSTPKSRKGRKETLLDKYDYRVTSLEYFVKNAVIRKLIDSSRGDFIRVCSINSLQDEYGDMITDIFWI